ncbi:hypothetical protein [Rhizobium sp. NFR12]|uniref:hypothetical protein n=1 Tax=Rhizobium sp. NFR12 TaxID=1566261 RepID=UPI0008A756CE|nr:hypothetical protein [Rhizobium sp. NFR12]SEH22524.1 hypothetical protein SAMN03159407_1168 [Rhizobium sp. NFR12]
MADPLALSAVFNKLPISTVKWDIQRNDELSGNGDGDVWSADLADPLWTAEITLGRGLHSELKQAAAILRALDGSRQAFMCCDPLSLFPQADPKGTILGSAAVAVRVVDADRRVLRVKGLPVGYTLTVGDKLQITQGSLRRFHEIGATVAASSTGQSDLSVFPRLPLTLAVDATVTLIRPSCPVIVAPGSHDPGTGRHTITEGATFKVLQKKRTS